jgi:drug/metabolite transporter (DMT)-like permease
MPVKSRLGMKGQGLTRQGDCNMGELIGVLAAAFTTVLGGLTVGVTRFVISATDPLTLGAFRFGIGCLLLLPFALFQLDRWPLRGDRLSVAVLGLLYFGLYPILFNASLAFTTAMRGALALSTTPILTMLAAAVVGIEPLTARKTLGVLIATLGVAIALLTGVATAPIDAWLGDLLMVTAALCQALYTVCSRPFIERSGTIPYTFVGMMFGALMLTILSWSRGGFEAVNDFGLEQWTAIAFLGLFSGALAFYLWTFALERTTPTRVAITITLNPVAAGVFGIVALSEPITWNLVAGLLLVLAGIWLSTSRSETSPIKVPTSPDH